MLPLCYAAPFESKILSSFIFQALIKKLPMFQMTWACLVAVDVVYIFSSILLIAGKSKMVLTPLSFSYLPRLVR